ncbi:MAG: M23 family metallopeptidase [Rhodoglobus sp.]
MIRLIAITALTLFISAPVQAPAEPREPAPPATWFWPVDPPHHIMRPFLAPATPYARGHRGIDLAAQNRVYAAEAGVVHFAGTVVDRPVLSIQHPGNLLSSYEPVQTTLHLGDVVDRGDLIGIIEPGHCASTCLHFGVRLHGEYVSPLLYLGGGEASILLPTRR